MSPLALALVLTSAVLHATWNLLAKRAGKSGGVVFVWLFTALSAVLFAPVAITVIVLEQPRLGPREVLFIAGSALLHIAYFTLLQSGYRVGDLSLVYPLARGTGPLLSTAAAIAFFGERPTALAVIGAGLIGVGVFVIAGGPRQRRHGESYNAVVYALLTGACIAAYTLWDKQVVSRFLVPPLVFDWSSNLIRTGLLSPFVLGRGDQIRAAWRAYRWEALGVAVLSPLSYILVLVALVSSPVSYIAPAREVSILIGAAMGSRLLAEGNARRRLLAAGAMALGVVFLIVG